MNKSSYFLLAVLFVTSVFPLPATASAPMQEEISHLLNYIEHSGCVFVRNKSRYNSKQAVEHIEKKYDYLKNRIKSTEDFIKGTATKSSMSGRPYMIICDGIEMETADWLRIELQQYRLK